MTCPVISVRRTEMSLTAGKIIVPKTNLAHKYKNKTHSGLNRACATRMYRSIVPLPTRNFRNYKSKFLLNLKHPRRLWSRTAMPRTAKHRKHGIGLNSIPGASQCQRESNVLHFKRNNAPLKAISEQNCSTFEVQRSRICSSFGERQRRRPTSDHAHLAKAYVKLSGLY